MNLPLVYSAEVAQAKQNRKPLVALESTIITHGMPYPDNLATARAVEQVVRDNGATPATIAILDSQIHIGLEPNQLETLAQAKNVMKLSRADLGFALSQNRVGATTVAATMICAHLAGIQVFATGGIGGVHKGAEASFDISADLHELAQTPVTVVCAGAKAILDLSKTLEVLETLGVPVIGYQTDWLPAFWSSRSDLPIPLRLNSPKEIAAAHKMRAALNLKGGQLICNPIPQANEISEKALAPIILTATEEARSQGIVAKQVTPFLLSRIVELTQGASLKANVALIKNNAKLAAAIAAWNTA